MHTRCQISTLKRKLENLTPAPTTPSSSARFTRLPGDGSCIPPIDLEDEEASEHREEASEHREYIGMMARRYELSQPPKESSEHDDCTDSQAVDSQAPGF